jgi:hypothetical protein
MFLPNRMWRKDKAHIPRDIDSFGRREGEFFDQNCDHEFCKRPTKSLAQILNRKEKEHAYFQLC